MSETDQPVTQPQKLSPFDRRQLRRLVWQYVLISGVGPLAVFAVLILVGEKPAVWTLWSIWYFVGLLFILYAYQLGRQSSTADDTTR
jgi:hypothetical protein